MQWPSVNQAENINEEIQQRIDKYLKDKLSEANEKEMRTWISNCIVEFAGTDHDKKDENELRIWYIYWFSLFPGIQIPTHPCKYLESKFHHVR